MVFAIFSFRTDNSRKKKVYEQQENEENPLRCPVKLYEFYLSKWLVLHTESFFYFFPFNFSTDFVSQTVRRVSRHGMTSSICCQNDRVCPIRPFGTRHKHLARKRCPKCYIAWRWWKKSISHYWPAKPANARTTSHFIHSRAHRQGNHFGFDRIGGRIKWGILNQSINLMEFEVNPSGEFTHLVQPNTLEMHTHTDTL